MTSPTSTTPSPPPSLSASTITKSSLDALLLRYDALITHLSASASSSASTKPPTPDLQSLDHLRYDTIPQRLAARKKAASTSPDSGDGAYLEKEEVEDLVRWKLYVPISLPPGLHRSVPPGVPSTLTHSPPPRRKHGTFRPRLTQLVASNAASTVRDTTRAAFALYTSSTPSNETYLPALKTLSTLAGIGPATASLLLAVYDPAGAPFFADELYWWVCCGGEWGRRIAYGVGEYRALWEGVAGVRERLGEEGNGGVRAVELERGAWVLGREGKGERKGRGVGKRKMEVEEARRDGKAGTEYGTEPDAVTPSPNGHDRSAPSTTAQPTRSISPPTEGRLSKPTDPPTKRETTAPGQLRRSKRTKRS